MNDKVPDTTTLQERMAARPLEVATADPVSPDVLLAFIEGTLDPDEARAIALRVAAEPNLALELRVARQIVGARGDAAAEAAAPSSGATADRRALWTALVAVAAAIVLFIWTRPPSLQDPGSDQIRSGGFPTVEAVNPGVPLPRERFVLRWRGGPASASYDVFVMSSDLQPLHSAYDVEATSLVVPPDALAALPSGARVLWRITVRGERGQRAGTAAFEAVLE